MGQRTLVPITCPQCLTEFQPRNRYKVFCSRACAASYRMNPEQRGQRDTRRVACATCGTEFLRRSKSNRYCSHRCYTEANKGAANVRFRGHQTVNTNGYLRFTKMHPTWPDEYVHHVIWHEANPGGRCADCGAKVRDVHHVDRDKQHNDLANLVGLCRGCHVSRHRSGSDLT